MADIYTRQRTSFGGSFASDLSALTIAGEFTPLGIVQNVTVNYSQQIARIYDVSNGGAGGGSGGQVPVYYVGGRTNGSASLSRVLGPQSGALCEFYTQMGNVCSPQDLSFTFAGGCGAASALDTALGGGAGAVAAIAGSNALGTGQYKKVIYTIEAAVMTSMGIGVGAQDMIVNENVALMFANLLCNENGDN